MEKIILFLFVACAQTTDRSLDPNTYYMRDMKVTIDGESAYGTMVAPKKWSYDISVDFPGKGDLVLLRTCHREEIREDLGRKEAITYRPQRFLEDQGDCIMEISAFSKDDGKHAWALIDFENRMWQLEGIAKCNGNSYITKGVTVCQSRAGLIQQLKFNEKFTLSPAAKCYPFFEHAIKDKTLEYKVPKEECSFVITGESGRRHKLTTIGYEAVFIRKLR